MAYDEKLASRIRTVLSRRRYISEKKMFGGVVYLLNGRILVGVWKSSLVVRLGAEQAVKALSEPFVREFDITGKPMKGWVLVSVHGVEEDDQLKHWIDLAMKFVSQLPVEKE